MFTTRLLPVLVLLLVLQHVFAQDVTGIWRGHFNDNNKINQILNIDDRYRFEVQIAQTEKKLQAVTYSYRTTEFYAKASATGSVNPKTGKVRVLELKIIEVRKGFNTFVCSMDCMLTWSKSGNEEFLEGTFVAMNTTDSSFCGKGTVFLRKTDVSDFYKEPFVIKREKEIKRKEEIAKIKPLATPASPKPVASKTPPKKNTTKPPVAATKKPPVPPTKKPANKAIAKATPQKQNVEKTLAPKQIESIAKTDSGKKNITIQPRKNFNAIVPPVIKNRKNEVVQTITVNTKTVELYIYDNGEIDHDTISVYLDNQLVVSRQMVSLTPIIVKLKMDDTNNYHEIVMVAENLGDIPPNTSLMIVKAGDKQYEAHIASTEQKNAVVIFKYEP